MGKRKRKTVEMQKVIITSMLRTACICNEHSINEPQLEKKKSNFYFSSHISVHHRLTYIHRRDFSFEQFIYSIGMHISDIKFDK